MINLFAITYRLMIWENFIAHVLEIAHCGGTRERVSSALHGSLLFLSRCNAQLRPKF